jgi:carboxylesterase type B
MVNSLIAFANTGNPSVPDMPWPAWTPQKERLMDFGDRFAVEEMDVRRWTFMSTHEAMPPTASTPTGPRD